MAVHAGQALPHHSSRVSHPVHLFTVSHDCLAAGWFHWAYVRVYLYGQMDLCACAAVMISIRELSWVTCRLCDGGQERRREGIPSTGSRTAASGSSLCNTSPSVMRNCDMSDCGFVKPLLRLVVSVVLSWNKTGFVCPPRRAVTKVFVCRSLEAGDLLSETGLPDRDQPQAGSDLPLWFWVLFGNALCGVPLLWPRLARCSLWCVSPNPAGGSGFPLTSMGFGSSFQSWFQI